jgi:hypothetical protein
MLTSTPTFELSDQHEPVWSVNSYGALECVQNQITVLRLTPVQALHLRAFLKIIDPIYEALNA